MAWSAPRTWVTDEVVTAALMNAEVRDNLIALKDPPSADYVLNEGADDSTSSTSFGDVDATNLALTIVTVGGDVFIHFHGTVTGLSAGNFGYFDVDVDGVRHAGDDGIIHTEDLAADSHPVSFTRIITGLAAASHTFKLQWKVSGGTLTLRSGAGTANEDTHPQYWCREIS